MYIIPYIIYLFYLFVVAHSCELMYNKDNDRVYLCTQNTPSNCFIFWQNADMTFCVVEDAQINASTLTKDYNISNGSQILSANLTYMNSTNISLRVTVLGSPKKNISTNTGTMVSTINSTNTSTKNVSIINSTSIRTNFSTKFSTNFSTKISTNTSTDTNFIDVNISIKGITINNTNNSTSILSTDNFTRNSSSVSFHSSATKDLQHQNTTNQTTFSYSTLIIFGIAFSVCYGYLLRKKYKTKQQSFKKSLPRKEEEHSPSNIQKPQQHTLKKRSLSMPLNKRESIKWKRNPFHNVNNTFNDKILFETLDNNAQKTLPEKPVFEPINISPTKEEMFDHENVLEECEILLSSIREDDLIEFEDVEEDLPLPSTAPPMIERDAHTVSSPKPSL